MKLPCVPIVCALVVSCALAPARAVAENDGQASLDRAIEKKLVASTVNDLRDVIDLCQKALDEGLDEENTSFAKRLLASALIQRASVVCTEVFKPWPEDPQGLRRVTGLRQFALNDLTRAVEHDPDQAGAHFLIARLNLLEGGDRQRAKDAIDRAIALAADDPRVQAQSLTIRGQLRDDPQESLEDFNAAVELAPGDADVLFARAEFYLETQKYEEALADLERALEIAPDNAMLYENRAVALAELGQIPEATENLDRSIELNPESATAYLRRARLRMVQQQAEGALEDLNQALELQPGHIGGLLTRATAYVQLGRRDEARADLERLAQVAPQMTAVRRTWMQLMNAVGQLDKALELLEAFHENEAPTDLELLVDISALYAMQGQSEKAVEIYTTVLEQEPDRWDVMVHRGDLYLRLGERAKALADYEAALEHQPESSGILNNVAWILATSPDNDLRDAERSIELATEACRLTDYQQAHILSTLAAAYAEAGDFETAIRWTKKALEISSPQLKDAIGKELANYEEGKPWREDVPPDYSFSPSADEPDEAPAKPSEPESPAEPDASPSDAEPGEPADPDDGADKDAP